MIEAPTPQDEIERQAALDAYGVLDTLPEQQFDDLTELAAHICGSKISLITLVDRDRQWFKSRVGLAVSETPRALAFCAHAIHSHDILYVPDATQDARFFDNPLVTGDPNVIFYAGAPIITPDGYRLGSLCVIDDHPRELSDDQLSALARLSRQVTSNLELRRTLSRLEDSHRALTARNEELEHFAYRTSHDLKSPIISAKLLAEYLLEDIESGSLSEASDCGNRIHKLMQNLEKSISDIVSLVRAENSSANAIFTPLHTLTAAVHDRLIHFADESQCQLTFDIQCDQSLVVQATRISQITDNLVMNGIKYRDQSRPDPNVSVTFSADDTHLVISVADNGIGIPKPFQADMYNLFKRGNADVEGSGLGLSIVKRHVDQLDGDVHCESTDHGTTFTVRLPLRNVGQPA